MELDLPEQRTLVRWQLENQHGSIAPEECLLEHKPHDRADGFDHLVVLAGGLILGDLVNQGGGWHGGYSFRLNNINAFE